MTNWIYANFTDGSVFLVGSLAGIAWGWFNNSVWVGIWWGLIVFVIVGLLKPKEEDGSRRPKNK